MTVTTPPLPERLLGELAAAQARWSEGSSSGLRLLGLFAALDRICVELPDELLGIRPRLIHDLAAGGLVVDYKPHPAAAWLDKAKRLTHVADQPVPVEVSALDLSEELDRLYLAALEAARSLHIPAALGLVTRVRACVEFFLGRVDAFLPAAERSLEVLKATGDGRRVPVHLLPTLKPHRELAIRYLESATKPPLDESQPTPLTPKQLLLSQLPAVLTEPDDTGDIGLQPWEAYAILAVHAGLLRICQGGVYDDPLLVRLAMALGEPSGAAEVVSKALVWLERWSANDWKNHLKATLAGLAAGEEDWVEDAEVLFDELDQSQLVLWAVNDLTGFTGATYKVEVAGEIAECRDLLVANAAKLDCLQQVVRPVWQAVLWTASPYPAGLFETLVPHRAILAA